MRRLQGIGVSPGVVSGRAVILNQRARVLRYRVPAARVARELERLEQGRIRTREQLRDIQAGLTARRGPELASMFDAQLLMLDDPMLVPRAAALIREQHVNAEWAVQSAFDEFSAVFDEIVDPYLRERKGDVADLVGRLRMNVRQGFRTPRDLLQEVDEASILVADELTPSLAAQVDWSKVRGFATDAGSRTYHTAILARSLDVPAVVGLHEASRVIQPGQLLVLDGSASELIVDPTESMLAYAASTAADRHPSHIPDVERGRPATTADGVHIRLEANIEFPDDLASVRYAGAEGIGLYRSEFLLTDQAGSIEEDAQFAVYRSLLEGMAPGPVTIRTFDVDQERLARHGDRADFGYDWLHDGERESRHGLRGLRLSLTQPDLFQTQLRALLRAARYGRLRVLFPFVSSVEQIRAARHMVSAVEADLRRAGESVPDVPIGVMIEIPAAAYAADILAREVDFFTIGTNDLIQYCLAVDRADERVSQLYQPLHPSVLRVIGMTRRAARRQGIPVSLCGEMASDPALLTLLVGLGLVEFSMTPGAIPVAKRVLADVRRDELHALARRVLRMATIAEIERELHAVLGRLTV
jgi:phosphoenolpyruvate-protein phosphotransferase (PTS system enzyme I)